MEICASSENNINGSCFVSVELDQRGWDKKSISRIAPSNKTIMVKEKEVVNN